MPRKTDKLQLHEGDFEYLRSLIKQRTIQAQVVIRAHILLFVTLPTPNYPKIFQIKRRCSIIHSDE